MAAATTVAIIGAGVGAALSFSQASQARRAQRKADKDAARFLADARKKAEKDFFAELNVPLDSYEAELENNLQTTTTAVEALQEGDARSLAAGVGKVGAQAQQTAEDVRIAMGEQMFSLDKMKAENRDDMNQQLISMDAAAAQDAAKRAADADAQVAAANTAGINSLTSGLMTGLQASPLYGKSKADRELMKALDSKGITMAEYTANPGKFPNVLGRQTPVVPPDGTLTQSTGVMNPTLTDRYVSPKLAQRGGQGPMNQVANPFSNFNLQMPQRRGLMTQDQINKSQQNAFNFQGYMGNDISQLYNPTDFNQRLNKFGVNSKFDYLSFLNNR